MLTATAMRERPSGPRWSRCTSTPGVGNAIGALYQANRGHSPLVVIGGDAGVRYMAMDAQMAGGLVDMAEPVTKWSTMVTGSGVVAADDPPGDQDRSHAAHGSGLRLPAGRTYSSSRAWRKFVPTSIPSTKTVGRR